MDSSQGPPRPIPPDFLLSGVGPGDYVEAGDLTVALLERYAGLGPTDRVLDVGCGLGRVAWPLAQKLGPGGSYEGFDVAPAYIQWCRENLGLDPTRFHFRHVDLRTRFYNPHGALEPADFAFPWPDAAFDLAIATSLFTHLLPFTVERYLREIARTLAPSGRLFATFYLLDERVRGPARAGVTEPSFPAPIEHGLVHDTAVPEKAVALEADWVLGALSAAGLVLTGVHPGRWQAETGPYYQDVVTAARP
jgi:SAM-dependent methyltransferase